MCFMCGPHGGYVTSKNVGAPVVRVEITKIFSYSDSNICYRHIYACVYIYVFIYALFYCQIVRFY